MGIEENKIKRGIEHLLNNMKSPFESIRKKKRKTRSCRICATMCKRATNYKITEDYADNCDMYVKGGKNFQPGKPAKIFFDGVKWQKTMRELDEIEKELEEYTETTEVYSEET